MKWFDMEDLDVIPRLMMDNTAVNVVQTEGKIKKLITWNDTTHLNMQNESYVKMKGDTYAEQNVCDNTACDNERGSSVNTVS